MEPTQQDHLTRRLRSLGDQPVDPEVVARHRSLMASVPVASSRSRLRPLMVGSLLAGSLLGGIGLAAAAPGVPDSASDVARNVLATVTGGAVNRPDRSGNEVAKAAKERAKAAQQARSEAKAQKHPAGTHGVTRSTEGCPAGFTGNHGQYVSSVKDDPATPDVNERQQAAESECGKPVNSGGEPEAAKTDADKPADSRRSNAEHGRQGTGKPDAATGHGRSGAHRADVAGQEADKDDDDEDNATSRRPANAGTGRGRPVTP